MIIQQSALPGGLWSPASRRPNATLLPGKSCILSYLVIWLKAYVLYCFRMFRYSACRGVQQFGDMSPKEKARWASLCGAPFPCSS